jgi:hypothetical protein
MKPTQIIISTEPYATIKWHSTTIKFILSTDKQEETEEEYEASIAVSEDENIGSRILEITFNDDLPEQVNEDEIKQLITDQFNKSEN